MAITKIYTIQIAKFHFLRLEEDEKKLYLIITFFRLFFDEFLYTFEKKKN